MSDKPA
ncbi:Superfamily II DNA and RNA helicase, partial [Candidatus Burkholderia humilis]